MGEKRSIDRRDFLGRAVSGAAALSTAGLAGCGSDGESAGPAVQTRKKIRWRLASSFPRGLDTLYGAAEVLARRLEALTGGGFTLRAHPAGEIVPALEVMDAVQQGTVQVGHTASYYYTGKSPALAFDAGVPWGLTYRQQKAWLRHGGGYEQMRDVFAEFNVVAFEAGSTGTQAGGWFRREINEAADLNGLKMRIPGLGGEVMSRLGVTVQVLGGGEIYQALERGAIDATEWVGPYDDEKLGFHQIAKYYYYPGWWEPGPTLSFLVNRDSFDRLPAEYQQALQAASAEAATDMMARYDAVNPPALRRLRDYGIEMRPFPADILEASLKTSVELYEELSAAEPAYRAIYEPWRQFRRDVYGWFDTAERAYADFAFPRP